MSIFSINYFPPVLKGAQGITDSWHRHLVFTCYTVPSGGKCGKFQTQGPWDLDRFTGAIDLDVSAPWKISKYTGTFVKIEDQVVC